MLNRFSMRQVALGSVIAAAIVSGFFTGTLEVIDNQQAIRGYVLGDVGKKVADGLKALQKAQASQAPSLPGLRELDVSLQHFGDQSPKPDHSVQPYHGPYLSILAGGRTI